MYTHFLNTIIFCIVEHKRKYGAAYYVSELSPLEIPTVLATENAGNSHTNKKVVR